MGAGSAVHSLRQRVASACLEFLGTNEISILQNDSWSSVSTSTQLFNQSSTLKFSSNESPFFLAAVFKICCRSNEFRVLNTLETSQIEYCSVLIDAIKQDIPHNPILQKRFYTETLLLRNNSELTNITAVTHLSDWLETAVRSSHASAAMNIHDSELESCLNIFDSNMEDLLLYLEEMNFGAAIISRGQEPEFPIIYSNKALAISFSSGGKSGRSELLGRSYLHPLASSINEEQMKTLNEAIRESNSARITLQSDDGSMNVVILEPLSQESAATSAKYMVQFFLELPSVNGNDTDLSLLEEAIEDFLSSFRRTLYRSGI